MLSSVKIIRDHNKLLLLKAAAGPLLWTCNNGGTGLSGEQLSSK